MRESIKLSKANPVVKRILAASFPQWRGRKVKAELTDRPVYIDTVGGGGSYDRAVAIQISEGRSAEFPNVSPYSSEYTRQIQEGVDLPPGVLLVVHSMFMGKDAGITIYAAPETAPALGGAVKGLLGSGE